LGTDFGDDINMFNIVLVTPEIPQNTGTIGRLCVCTEARLHLIKPLGFQLDESKIRRAGMDYWQYLDLTVYENWQDFRDKNTSDRFFFISTKGEKNIYEAEYQQGDYLIFGCEGSGLPAPLYEQYRKQLYLIPMPGSHSRSHNLANSVSITLYEGMRQIKYAK